MKCKYVGGLAPGISVVDRDTGRIYETDEDGVVDVTEELGASLLEQTIWEAAATPKQTPKPTNKDSA